jgi:hydroxymethylpyrimidine/phosphomethylpyrimidine kinase
MKTVLVIAGLDPSGGAGFLADVRVVAEHGARAVGVVTATTVQDTAGVRAVEPVAPETLGEALEVLLQDVEVDAVKIGMLGDAGTAAAVARALAATRAPVVWDPVFLPSRGGVPLLRGDPGAAAAALLPEVRVVTPNLAEAAALTGVYALDVDGMRRAARAIPAAAVLVKGGHLGGETAPDLLRDGAEEHVLDGARVAAGPLHGTGCVLSTALACRLAAGQPLHEAARGAKEYLGAKLVHALTVGRGARCLV